MSNITKSIGNFQANVGKLSSNINVITSYIIAGLLILIAIGFAIYAFIPQRPVDCEDNSSLKDDINTYCNTTFKNECEHANSEYDRCQKKTKNLVFLWFLLLIPLGIIIVIIMKWWNHIVHTNKTAAQLQGTLSEVGMIKDIFSN